MTESLGREVLTLEIDDANFARKLQTNEQAARQLGATFDRTSQQAKQLGATSQALQAALDDVFGTQLEQRARASATAILQVGGAHKLTDDEARRHLGTLNEWIAKAQRLGREVSPHILQTRDALEKVNVQSAATPDLFDRISARGVALGAALGSFLGNVAWSAVNRLGGEVMNFVAQGAKFPGLQASFERLASSAGQDSRRMRDELRTATMGMVADYSLMESANKAMLLGLPVTTASMGELAKTATILGRAMGQDATKSLDDLITALGRSSPMILDNLGLTVKVGEANDAYARKLGKSAEQLTEAEKKTAFYEAAMEAARAKTAELGEVTLTLGEHVTAVWTRIENNIVRGAGNINVVLGHAISSWRNFLDFMAKSATFTSWEEMREQIEADARGAGPTGATRKRGRAGNSDQFQFEELQRQARELADRAIVPLTAAQRELVVQFDKGGLSAAQIADRLNAVAATAGVTERQIAAFVDGQKRAAQEMQRTREEAKKQAEQFEQFRAKLVESKFLSGQIGEQIPVPKIPEMSLFWQKWDKEIVEGFKRPFTKLPGTPLPIPEIPPVPPTFWDKVFGTGKHGTGSSGFGAGLANAIMGAIQGGGNVIEAGGSFVGEGIMSGFAKHLTTAKEGGVAALSGWLGGAANAVLPMLGTLLGPLASGVSSFLGKIFDRNKGRDLVEQFAESMGGFDALRARLNGLGDEGERLWRQLTQGVGRNNPQQAQAAIDAINRALESAEARTATFNGAIGGLLTRIRDLGTGLPDSLRKYLDELQRAGRLTQENIDLLATLAGEGAVDWKKIEEAVGRYGGDISTLGGTFQEQRLHESWQQVIDDIDLFTRGNIAANDVLDLTQGKIIELVQQSIKFGTEIPENMRPWIQSLIDSGELVDENGEKITDIGKLKFGETLQTSLQKLTDEIMRLIEELQKVPGAVGAIPRSVDVEVNYRPGRRPETSDGSDAEVAASGGFVTFGGIQYRGRGGVVFRPRGTDIVPAMLTPGEGVLNLGAMSMIGRDGLAALNEGRGLGRSLASSVRGMTQHIRVQVGAKAILETVFDGFPEYADLMGVRRV
jgi:DNA-directed RNA polymerase specialized sigma24 family protein